MCCAYQLELLLFPLGCSCSCLCIEEAALLVSYCCCLASCKLGQCRPLEFALFPTHT